MCLDCVRTPCETLEPVIVWLKALCRCGKAVRGLASMLLPRKT